MWCRKFAEHDFFIIYISIKSVSKSAYINILVKMADFWFGVKMGVLPSVVSEAVN